MEHHPYFDIWLHSNAELCEIMPFPVIERVMLHEWPLSCVQKLTLADGTRLIYKAQVMEGVEPDFYEHIHSTLLPAHHLLGTYKNTTMLYLEFIDAPRMDHLLFDEQEIVRHGQNLSAEIRQINREVPVYADLSSPALWDVFVDETLAKLSRLVESGQFQRVKTVTLSRLAAWARAPHVIEAIRDSPGLAHADLSGENVFLTPAGYKVIDWQYPRLAPFGFDLASFLDYMGCDPYQYVDAAVVDIVWFVRLAWFVESKTHLFPAGESYDYSVESLAEKILLIK